MNNEQKELLDEAYENFEKQCIPGTGKKMSKEEFIEFIKTNNEFSNHWGLKIEERELSLDGRVDIFLESYNGDDVFFNDDEHRMDACNDNNIPTKAITIKYNDKKIESYE